MLSQMETKYWTKRRELEDLARLKLENKTLKKLTSIFPDALKEIQSELLAQADLHDITYAEMMQFYSTSDQKKYREYVETNYKSLKMYDAKYKEFIEEYFPAFDYAKVNRLLQIRSDIFKILAEHAIDSDVNKYFSDQLEDILQRSYSSNSNVLAQLLNVDLPNYLPKEELERYLNYPWSGKTFSRRLWGNVSSLEQKLSNAITKSVASGEGVINALRTMRDDPEICDMFKHEESKYNRAIENLVRTEYAKFAQDGIEKSYKETGVNEYNVLTAKDEKVCRICGGKAKDNPYKLFEAVIGENRAPFHGRCRCTDVPNMPKLGKDIDAEYERLFGDLLDEFANDRFGIKLSHVKKKPDIIKEEDIQLPKSISAKARDIYVKRDIALSNRKDKIKAGSRITKVKTIAGKGVSRKIDIAEFLVEKYPNTKAADWQKKIGFVELDNGERIEVHWFEAPNVGKVMFKEKRWN